jgi:hypothetical protein
MTKPTRQEMYIFDHPESRVRFLEASLVGDDWRATIVIPPSEAANPDQHAQEMAAIFKARGYAASVDRDGTGTALLHIHHFGKTSSPLEAVREMGLGRGTSFTIAHLGQLAGSGLVAAADFFSYVIKEPARLFNGIYLAGDGFMSASEIFHKNSAPSGVVADPNQFKRLKRVQGTIGTVGTLGNWAQSLIDLKYAKNGAELNIDALNEAFNAGQKRGIDATNFQAWSDPNLSRNALSPLADIAKRKPIETGAWAMVAAQLSFITARSMDIFMDRQLLQGQKMPAPREWMKLLRMDDGITATDASKTLGREVKAGEEVYLPIFKRTLGSHINLLRAGLSISGWQLFTHQHKHHDHLTGWTQNPFKRLGEEIDNHTEQAVATLTASASVVGLAAAAFSRNGWQMAAESIWLAGDCVIFLVNKENYGENSSRKELPLIEAATKFLKTVPVSLGPAAEAQMINDLASHLAHRTVNDGERKTKIQNPEKMEAEVQRLTIAIATGLKANMASHHTIFKKIAYQSAVIAGKFGKEKGPAVADKIAESLGQAPGLYGSTDEWKTAIKAAMKQVVVDDENIRGISQLTNDIAQLVLSSPAASNAGVAMAAYDAVASFLPANPMGVTLLQKAITAEASKQLQRTPAQLAAMDAAARQAAPALQAASGLKNISP